MAAGIFVLFYLVLVQCASAVRINFTSCQNGDWSCVNNVPNEIVYTCPVRGNNDFVIHLKDYYTDHITSVTVQNCRDLRVVLDCPMLQRTSQLQRFTVKDCDRLEFVTLATNSLLQTPPEVTIENCKEIISLPRRMFKSPNSNTESKCLGGSTLKKIRIANSKINEINTKAIYNVTGIKTIEFDNVTIADIRSQGIDAIMGEETSFTLRNSKVENLDFKGIIVQSSTATITDNTFNDLIGNSVNITADNLRLIGNRFREIRANGLVVKSVNADISHNDINTLKSNALSSIRCVRKRVENKRFVFSSNRLVHVEPNSLAIDYNSCKAAGTTVAFNCNKMDCICRHIAFLNANSELYNTILDPSNNNTCLSAPCILPVDILKIILESDMCHLSLDPQVMCLLYSDKHTNNSEVTSEEDATEPPPTFYLIRQANANAMTSMDKDDLLKDSHLNMTNRTAIKVVFDSSRDFVETLRGTSSHKRLAETKPPQREEYVNRCVGPKCRNNVAYDRQKASDFYKYIYAQLRPPRPNDNKKKKT